MISRGFWPLAATATYATGGEPWVLPSAPANSVSGKMRSQSTRWRRLPPLPATFLTLSNISNWRFPDWNRPTAKLRKAGWNRDFNNIRAADPLSESSARLVPMNIGRKPAVDAFGIVEGPQFLVQAFEFLPSLPHRITSSNRRSRCRLQNFLKLFVEIFRPREFRNHRMFPQMSQLTGVGNC